MNNKTSILIGSVIHIQMVELSRFQVDNVVNNEKLRIEYLRNRIQEDKFKVMVQREHTKFEKKKDIYDVLTMFIQCSTDIVLRFAEELETIHGNKAVVADHAAKLTGILEEMNPLVDYVNECLDTISKTYHSVTWEIKIPNEHLRYDLVLTSHKKKAGS
jgi:hypothetical protein